MPEAFHTVSEEEFSEVGGGKLGHERRGYSENQDNRWRLLRRGILVGELVRYKESPQ